MWAHKCYWHKFASHTNF